MNAYTLLGQLLKGGCSESNCFENQRAATEV